jgi:hypothetical protein
LEESDPYVSQELKRIGASGKAHRAGKLPRPFIRKPAVRFARTMQLGEDQNGKAAIENWEPGQADPMYLDAGGRGSLKRLPT